jgi:hypothetical protein
MKEIIKNILKEEQEYGELEQSFRNSMQKLQYIFESNISSEIDSVDISEIEFDPKYTEIQANLTVKSYYEDHDFGSLAKQIDRLEDEVYKIQGEYTFTENGGLIKRGPDNDWFMSCVPIGMKWQAGGDESFILTLDFWVRQDEYDA